MEQFLETFVKYFWTQRESEISPRRGNGTPIEIINEFPSSLIHLEHKNVFSEIFTMQFADSQQNW